MPPLRKKLVLVVDDTPTEVAVISGVLKDSFRIKVATNGKKALAMARASDKPDLILLDVVMPGMDGFRGLPPSKGHYHYARNPGDIPDRGD